MEPKQSGPDGTEQTTRSGGGWHFPVLLAIALLILLGFSQRLSQQTSPHGPETPVEPIASWTPSPQPEGEIVRLTIDFGNGATKEFAALPWREGMTVADLLENALRFRPGIQYVQIGSGESGFLSSLDGLANEGAQGRNWLYRVDDRHAHVSYCREKLDPGMHVLWTFTDQQYNPEAAEE